MKAGQQITSMNEVSVADVIVRDRLRDVSDAGVGSLMASIERLGGMTDPIQVRRMKDGMLVLMAGEHRLEAAKRLGWDMIPAVVWTCNDAWARFMEIDDNLAGSELTVLDTAVFLAHRKRLYEEQFPETRAGVAGASARWNATDTMSVASGPDQTDIVSFCSATAEKIGASERHIRRLVAAGEKLGPVEVERLRKAPKPVKLSDLQEIAKLGDHIERLAVVQALSEGEAKTAADALKQIRPGKLPKSPTEQSLHRLLDAWDRAPMAARRSFMGQRGKELIRFLDEVDHD